MGLTIGFFGNRCNIRLLYNNRMLRLLGGPVTNANQVKQAAPRWLSPHLFGSLGPDWTSEWTIESFIGFRSNGDDSKAQRKLFFLSFGGDFFIFLRLRVFGEQCVIFRHWESQNNRSYRGPNWDLQWTLNDMTTRTDGAKIFPLRFFSFRFACFPAVIKIFGQIESNWIQSRLNCTRSRLFDSFFLPLSSVPHRRHWFSWMRQRDSTGRGEGGS